MVFKNLILLTLLVLTCVSIDRKQELTELDNQVDTLNDQAYANYEKMLGAISSFDQQELGMFLCITGKRFLYGSQTKQNHQPDYLKAYFYIKVSAQQYNNADCLYYLGLLYNFRLTPHYAINKNMEELHSSKKSELQLIQLTKSMHLSHADLYLYLSSLGNNPKAQMILANLNKIGLSTQKNCTAAALYYLSVGEKMIVNEFQQHIFYRDGQNYERELYLKKRKEYSYHIEDQAFMISETLNLDEEGTNANLQIAKSYFYGRGGFTRNYQQAVTLFNKLRQNGNSEATSLLAYCYFKGNGVPKSYRKAYELFKQSKNDFGLYMMTIMDYTQVGFSNNKTLALQKLTNMSKSGYSLAKSFLGAIIVKGEVFNKTFADGITLLEEASNRGNLMPKFIIGTIYLDGTQFHYDCQKGVKYLSEALSNTDTWTDLIEHAKLGFLKNKFGYSFIKYLELSLIGDSVGMINGLYIIEIYEEVLRLKADTWNYKLIYRDNLYKILQKQNKLRQKQVEKILFADYLQLVSLKILIPLLKVTPTIQNSYKTFIYDKLLFICELNEESICKFLNYKKDENKKISKLYKLANSAQEKLHIYESRYLLGKYIQNLNKSENAKIYYMHATGSEIISEIIWIIEGGDTIYGFVDDLFIYLSFVIIMVGVAFVHRNMIMVKIHKRERQNLLKKISVQENQQSETSGLRQKQQINMNIQSKLNSMMVQQKEQNSNDKVVSYVDQEVIIYEEHATKNNEFIEEPTQQINQFYEQSKED